MISSRLKCRLLGRGGIVRRLTMTSMPASYRRNGIIESPDASSCADYLKRERNDKNIIAAAAARNMRLLGHRVRNANYHDARPLKCQ